MLATFKNKTVTILRLTAVTGDRKALATVQSADCSVQNIDTRHNQAHEGIASKTYMAWFEPEEDVREGDILRDQGNNRRFKVIGVERQGQGLGLMAEHLEVVLVRFTG